MNDLFFKNPILNSPYEYPSRYWELDENGQPTQKIIENRRRAEFITPIPKPRKQRRSDEQLNLVFDEGKGLSTEQQQYDPTSIINSLRNHIDKWRMIPDSRNWNVTPETARLFKPTGENHRFGGIRPFFLSDRKL